MNASEVSYSWWLYTIIKRQIYNLLLLIELLYIVYTHDNQIFSSWKMYKRHDLISSWGEPDWAPHKSVGGCTYVRPTDRPYIRTSSHAQKFTLHINSYSNAYLCIEYCVPKSLRPHVEHLMKAIENSCLAYWVVNGIRCMSKWTFQKGCKGVKQLKNNVIGLLGYWV